MKAYVLLALLAICGAKEAAASTTTTSPQAPPPPPPPPSDASGTAGAGRGRAPNRPPPPVWVQCLSTIPPTLPELFKLWCSDYERIITCLTNGLSTPLARNPLDHFVNLYFEAEQLKQRSVQLCQNFQAISNTTCVQQNNASVESWCHALFGEGQQFVLRERLRRRDNNIDLYKNLACQVINDTTACLGSSMIGCNEEEKRHLLAFYAFFTNESCLAEPDAEFNIPPPPPPRTPPRDILITCGQRVAKASTPSPPPQNASPLDVLVYGLRQNCRTFEPRYRCYDEELNKNSTSRTFRDLWLEFTFNSSSAILAQEKFCKKFEGGLVNSLNETCFNRIQPILRRCERAYDNRQRDIQQVLATRQLPLSHDELQSLHGEACRARLWRAFCLRDAFKLCGETLAEAMLQSEQDTLPNICLSLLPSNDSDSNSTTTTDDAFQEPAAEQEPVGEFAPHAHSSISPVTDSDNMEKKKPVQTGAVTGEETDKGKDSLASGLGCSILLMVFTGSASLFLHA